MYSNIRENSGLNSKKDFQYGYSPERINPGDKLNKLGVITKIVSGSNKKTTTYLINYIKKLLKKLM